MQSRKQDKESPIKRQGMSPLDKEGIVGTPPTPGSAEGDENTVEKALRNKEGKEKK